MKFKKSITILLTMALSFSLLSAEVDNYSLTEYVDQDVTGELNEHVNLALKSAINQYNVNQTNGKKQDKLDVVKIFYRQFEKTPLVSKTRLWVQKNVDYFPAQKEHIYKGMPLFGGFILKIYGIVGNLTLNHIPVGLDKLGHFLDGGYAMFKRIAYKGKTEEQALQWSRNTESSILGKTSTGVFSNGDLVANYEGNVFYHSILNDDAVLNKLAIVKFKEGFAYLNREFDWHDHVNEFWNEAIAPSHFSKLLQKHVIKELPDFCQLFEARPELFKLSEERDEELQTKYKKLGLKIVFENRLSNICPN